MKFIFKKLIPTSIALSCLIAPVLADDARQIIADFQNGTLPITETDTPILLPFAIEWDALATTGDNAKTRAKPEQYQMLTVPDQSRLKASIDALGNNEDAMKFFTDDNTVEAFNMAYEKAISSGSSVGMIPHEQAMKYWILSRIVSAGPEAIGAYPEGYASPEWCLPPLIRCTPPIPAPKK